jgi:nicotinate-nucleotide adenylyltransferase
VVVLVNDLIRAKYVATRPRAKPQVLDVRYEMALRTDVTELEHRSQGRRNAAPLARRPRSFVPLTGSESARGGGNRICHLCANRPTWVTFSPMIRTGCRGLLGWYRCCYTRTAGSQATMTEAMMTERFRRVLLVQFLIGALGALAAVPATAARVAKVDRASLPARVTLWGGSFSPPHLSHGLNALWPLEHGYADHVLWVPAFQHAFKGKLMPFHHRVEMCKRHIQDLKMTEKMSVSKAESALGGVSRTLRLVRHLQARHPSTRFSLLIGSDLAAELHRWHGIEQLRQEADFILLERAGSPWPGAIPCNIPAMSSTEVNQARATGGDLSRFLSPSVLDYLQRHLPYPPR